MQVCKNIQVGDVYRAKECEFTVVGAVNDITTLNFERCISKLRDDSTMKVYCIRNDGMCTQIVIYVLSHMKFVRKEKKDDLNVIILKNQMLGFLPTNLKSIDVVYNDREKELKKYYNKVKHTVIDWKLGEVFEHSGGKYIYSGITNYALFAFRSKTTGREVTYSFEAVSSYFKRTKEIVKIDDFNKHSTFEEFEERML